MNQSIKKQLNKIILQEIDELLLESKVLTGLVGGSTRKLLQKKLGEMTFAGGVKLSGKQIQGVLGATRSAFIKDKSSKALTTKLLAKAGQKTWSRAANTALKNPDLGPSALVKSIIANSGNKLTQKEAMKIANSAVAYRNAITNSIANTTLKGGEKIGLTAARDAVAGRVINVPAVIKPPGVPAVKPPAGVPAVKPPAGVPAVKPPAGVPAVRPPAGVPAVVKPPKPPVGGGGGPLAVPGAAGGALAIPQAATAVWKFAGLSPLGYAVCTAVGAATIYLISGGDDDAAAKKIDDIPNMTPEQKKQAKEAMQAAKQAVLSGSIAAIDKLLETLKENNPGGAFDALIAWLEKKRTELAAAAGQRPGPNVDNPVTQDFLTDPSVLKAAEAVNSTPDTILKGLANSYSAPALLETLNPAGGQPLDPLDNGDIARLKQIANYFNPGTFADVDDDENLPAPPGPPGPKPPKPTPGPPGPQPPRPTPGGGGSSWRVKETTQFERVARRVTGLPTREAVMKIQEMLVNAGFSVSDGGAKSGYGPEAEPLQEAVIKSNKSYKQISNAWKRFMIVSEARVPKSKFAEVGIDGYAGKETIAAVKAFQKAMIKAGKNLGKYGPNKDGVDGIVGKYTYKVLQDVLSGKDKSVKPPAKKEKQPSADMKKKYPEEFPDTAPDAAGERMRQKVAADDIAKADAAASSREKRNQGTKGFVRAMNSWFRSSDNSYIRGMYNFIKANKDVLSGTKLENSGFFWAALINVDKPRLKKILGDRYNKSPQLKIWAKNKVPKQLKDLASKFQSEMDQFTKDFNAHLDSQEPSKIASDMKKRREADAAVYTNPKDKKPPRSAKYLFGRMEIIWEKAGGRVVKKGGKVTFASTPEFNPSTGKNYYTTFVLEPHGVPGRNYFGPGDGNVYAKRVRRLHGYFVKKFNISKQELDKHSEDSMKGLTDMLDNLPGDAQ